MARVLVTRPEPDAADTVARLGALGIEGLAAPLLERAMLHARLPAADGFAGIALTSANALHALDERGVLERYLGLRVFAVGERTAEAAKQFGFPDVVNAGGSVRHLVEEIATARPAGPIFYPAARHQSADLAHALAPFGVTVVPARVYEMRAAATLPHSALAGLSDGSLVAALFYSRRTAETFVTLTASLLPRAERTRIGVLCLSEQIAEPLLEAHFVRASLAEQPSEDAMMALTLAFVRDQNTA
jgi:uroporphyrinogen-III synthase